MHQPSPPNLQLFQNQHHQPIALPYHQLPMSLPSSLSTQQFIKEWIDRIFISNRKIESEARVKIAREIAKFKLFELSSCSSVYELIRHKIEQTSQKLRNFIDVSYGMLNKQSSNLSQLVVINNDGILNQTNQQITSNQKMIFVPISKMTVLFYKFICGSLKQVYNLWKIIYPSIPVRDLQKSTFQKSISTFVLQIFCASSKTFSPVKMYPSMSLVNKTKFICADSSEGIARRLQLTKFSQDELKRVLLQKKSKIKSSNNLSLQELNDSQRRLLQEIIGFTYFNKKAIKSQPKLKVDIPFIEELKDKASSTEVEIYPIGANLDEYYQKLNNLKTKYKKIETELLTPFEPNSGLLYQMEDNSSQEQDLGNFYDDKDCGSQELYLQSEDIMMEYINARRQTEHKQNDASAKLSSSTANEEHNQIKNQEQEIQNQIPIDHLNPQETDSQETKLWEMQNNQSLKKDQDQIEKIIDLTTGQYVQTRKETNCSHFSRKNQKIQRTQNSKRYLQEEKQKLQKYRKELQKEKEELLREVERFMKEKQRDQKDFKRINNCFNFQSNHRHARSTCECHQELKNFNFESDKNKLILKGLKQLTNPARKPTNNQNQPVNQAKEQQNLVEQQITNQIYKDMNTDSLEDSNIEITYQNGNSSSKKKQKNKKKLQKQQPKNYRMDQKNIIQIEKVYREIDQDEAQLIKFMENLKINDSTRVTWNIEESKIESWKERQMKIRNNETLNHNTPNKEQQKPQKSKKKQKR